ncbi:MAG: MMPL family transporter, partial [Ginsengibacter sp.]
MWKFLANIVIKQRLILLLLLATITVVMAFFASKVQLSYEFAKAIPTDNEHYKEYMAFKQKFGDDGNLLVIGIQSDSIFNLPIFSKFSQLMSDLKKIVYVEDIVAMPLSINLVKNIESEKLDPKLIFQQPITTQQQLDSDKLVFFSLPFYKTLLYNSTNNSYLVGVHINKAALNSAKRTLIVENIVAATNRFTAQSSILTHISGLPFIRTEIANRIAQEMKWFLIGSLVLSTLILLLLFRSISTTLISLGVVLMGVIWSFGTLYMLGYNLTLLNALIPPLVVVIGIPNCIYFLNKYHTNYIKSLNKRDALIDMVSKMGIVTLFCNLTAAIGFGVFAFTKSAVLKEFGIVAGISIMLIFVISFIFLPAILSYVAVPGKAQTKYLSNPYITALLTNLQQIVLHKKGLIYTITAIMLCLSIAGIFRLKSEAFIVDDLPKNDRIYTDLKFFEKNFSGVMPLEIIIDTRKKYGLAGAKSLAVFEKVDSLSQFISQQPLMSRPLSIAEGLKFAKQAFYEGDTANYTLPNSFDGAFVGEYLKPKQDTSSGGFAKLLSTFIDSSRQSTRISVNMADIGTVKLPAVINTISEKANQIFDSSKYDVTFTGSSITFLEGSRYIINGLKESIFWAFILIAFCMLYLFKSLRIVICSLLPNLIPLIVTAGIMGWAGIRLKPSTVLVFSVALGIAIDVTIRFLVNYKQELSQNNFDVESTVINTIKTTGLSILYTSMVLVAGFIIFCFSNFGGTQALGWLT